jgi:ABC-type Zn2+ transport system substrate-binding protein/surface adhesin
MTYEEAKRKAERYARLSGKTYYVFVENDKYFIGNDYDKDVVAGNPVFAVNPDMQKTAKREPEQLELILN